jgi:hypothetical protein
LTVSCRPRWPCAYVATTNGLAALVQCFVLLAPERAPGAAVSPWTVASFAAVAWAGGVRGWQGDAGGRRLCVAALAVQCIGWCSTSSSFLWMSGLSAVLHLSATASRAFLGFESTVLLRAGGCDAPVVWLNLVPMAILAAWGWSAKVGERRSPSPEPRRD